MSAGMHTSMFSTCVLLDVFLNAADVRYEFDANVSFLCYPTIELLIVFEVCDSF